MNLSFTPLSSYPVSYARRVHYRTGNRQWLLMLVCASQLHVYSSAAKQGSLSASIFLIWDWPFLPYHWRWVASAHLWWSVGLESVRLKVPSLRTAGCGLLLTHSLLSAGYGLNHVLWVWVNHVLLYFANPTPWRRMGLGGWGTRTGFCLALRNWVGLSGWGTMIGFYPAFRNWVGRGWWRTMTGFYLVIRHWVGLGGWDTMAGF